MIFKKDLIRKNVILIHPVEDCPRTEREQKWTVLESKSYGLERTAVLAKS